MTGIQPAARPPAGLLDDLKKAGRLRASENGSTLAVVGYGCDLGFPPPHIFRPYPPVEVVYDGKTILFDLAQRQTAQSGYLGLNDAWLHFNQSTPAAGYGGTERGDSGGPVFWSDPDGNEVLVSVASWGPLVGVGFYYRIDTKESLDFIQDVIDSLEE